MFIIALLIVSELETKYIPFSRRINYGLIMHEKFCSHWKQYQCTNVTCLMQMDKQFKSWTVKIHTILLVHYSTDFFQQLIVMKLLVMK